MKTIIYIFYLRNIIQNSTIYAPSTLFNILFYFSYNIIQIFIFYTQVVIVHSLVFSILSYILSCTLTICWPLWDQIYKNTYGGRNIWPLFRWCNSWPLWFMLSNFCSWIATTRKLSSGGSVCTPLCSSSSSRNSTNNPTRNRNKRYE